MSDVQSDTDADRSPVLDADGEDDLDPDALSEEFDDLLGAVDIAAEAAIYKLQGSGRITDAKKEQARSKWANTLIKACREKRQIMETRELVRFAEQIDELKEKQRW